MPDSETVVYRLGEVEKDVLSLTRKVDRLMWAIVSLAFSIAGSAIVFVITAASIGNP
jgi:hypothetical protein